MAMSRGTTAWVVSGAIGLASFTVGTIASQGSGQAAPESRPAVVVPASGPASATATPTKDADDARATAPAKQVDTGPSPVSPPSAETPD